MHVQPDPRPRLETPKFVLSVQLQFHLSGLIYIYVDTKREKHPCMVMYRLWPRCFSLQVFMTNMPILYISIIFIYISFLSGCHLFKIFFQFCITCSINSSLDINKFKTGGYSLITLIKSSIYSLTCRVYNKVDNFETALNFTNPFISLKFLININIDCLGTYNVE